MMRAKLVLAARVLPALVLVGCAVSPPAPSIQAPAAPAAWQTPWPAAAAGPSAATPSGDWWAGFGDPLLPSLIAAAQGASPTLSTAAARIEAARAARVAAGAALQPQVDAAASLSRTRATPGLPATDAASIGVQAGWELDLFGARTAAREAASRRLEVAQAQWQAARVALAAEVGTSYVALRACEAQMEQTAADAQSRAQTARLSERSAEAGMLAPASAALTRASAAQGRAQLAQQRAACEALVKSLVALTALEEAALRQRLAVDTRRQPQPAAVRVASVPAALLQQRPDLVAAARQVQAAAADRDAAAADRWPKISLSGNVGLARVATGGTSQDGVTWAIGPLAMSLPLLDGGRRAAQEGAASAAYEDAAVQLQAALRAAVREVEEALVTLESAAAREADVGVAAEGFEASLRAADARWRGGVGSLFELEDARRSALAARGALVELRRERATAWINLYRALGGGWSSQDLANSPR
jgi:NodT family efflux transporter outer membrane factor (OMF) lipoprotein